MRQTEDEIDADGVVTLVAHPVECLARDVHWLQTMHRQLHLRIRVLDPQRRPVAAEFAECADMVACNSARVDLDAVLGVRGELESGMNGVAQSPDYGWRQEGRGASAEMHLLDAPAGGEKRLDQRQLLLEISDVVRGGVALQGDDSRAAAEPAERLAERKVEIEGERASGVLVVPADGFDQRLRRRRVRKLRRGRIGRIPRTWNVVLSDQCEVEFDGGRRRSNDGTGRNHGRDRVVSNNAVSRSFLRGRIGFLMKVGHATGCCRCSVRSRRFNTPDPSQEITRERRSAGSSE